MATWVEIRTGDTILFKNKSGTGSVVLTENNGNYFMPAKIGMRIKGIKKPIKRSEEFIFSGSTVQAASGTSRIVKCELLRLSDNTNFYVSEMDLMTYFSKSNKSQLGGIDL
jgi:hypothetical protein